MPRKLPKMAIGGVHVQFVRCGKENCKCAAGILHGPYYAYFRRVNGRLRKRYLRKDEVAGFIKALDAVGSFHQRETSLLNRSWNTFSEVREIVRAAEIDIGSDGGGV